MTVFLLLFLLIIGAVSYVLAQQPNDFRITRTQTFNVPPEKIFEHVNNLKRWNAWSPWARIDPKTVTKFEGPEAGVGAIMRWSGNNKVGQGSMTIIESKEPSIITLKMDFLKPMKAVNSAEFTFTTHGGETVVSWSIYGANPFVRKVFDAFLNCDNVVGTQFEKGLMNLKGVVEAK